MIIANRNTEHIVIPIHHQRSRPPYTLELIHKLTGEKFKISASEDPISDPKYAIILVNFDKYPTGDYNYYLNSIETGLLRITSDDAQVINYNTEKRIIQYGD